MKKYLSTIFACIIIFLVIFTYRNLVHSFFEQDEWGVYAAMIIFHNYSFIEKIKFIFSSSGILSHFIPFTTLVAYFMNTFLGVQTMWYFMFSIFLHTANSLLTYFLAKKLTKNSVIAFGAALLFGIHKLSSQAVTWQAASVGAELSTFFLLASIILYMIYLERKKTFFFITSIITFVLSIFSKESSISLVIIYPILFLFTTNKKISWKILKDSQFIKSTWFILTLLATFVLKFILLLVNPFIPPGVVTKGPGAPAYFLLIKIFFYPLLTFSQIYDWNGTIASLSKNFLIDQYPFLAKNPAAPTLYDTLVPDVLYLLASSVFLFFILFVLYSLKKLKLTKIAVFCLIGYFISIIPYVPLPRFTTFIEPRYFYTPNIFAAIFLAVFVFIVLHRFFSAKISSALLIIFVIIVSFVNYQNIQESLDDKIYIAQQRETILFQFKSLMPHLPTTHTVIYVTGTGPDYLTPDLKVPFQSGFGNVLMVWYYNPKYITSALLDNGFLYQLDDQGYKTIGNFGFGYYYQEDKMLQDLKMNRFSLDSVVGFSWDNDNEKLTDITDKIKKDLEIKLHE